MSQMRRATISIQGTPGAFTATIDQMSFTARRNDSVRWKVREAPGFPRDAVVFVQFVTGKGGLATERNGCMVDGNATGGRHDGRKTGPEDHFVNTQVAGDARQGPYRYEISYRDSTGVHLLLDPEIVVEGDTPPPDDDEDITAGGPPPGRPKPSRAPKSKPGAGARPKASKRATTTRIVDRKAGKKKAAKKAAKKAGQKRAVVRRAKTAKKGGKTRKAKKR